MKLHARAFLLAAGFASVAALAVPAQAAAVIKTQNPCTTSEGICLRFGNTGAIPTIRSFQFTAPSKGTAAVTFHGSLQCAIGPAVPSPAGVELESQIVATGAAIPDMDGPGGLRHGTVLVPAGGRRITHSFNLASTRVVAFTAAGAKTFHFKIARRLMEPGSFCTVQNGAFTVVFVP
jgi:hypothetical protein